MSENRKEFERWLLAQLAKANQAARKGKRNTEDEHSFELNESENLIRLRDTIVEEVYKPSKGVAFITFVPVIREIFAAPYRDRVIHHLLFNLSAEWWDKRLIYKSGSCRKGKGTLFMIDELKKDIQAVSQNYTQKAYVVKMDVHGYFMSLNREKLYKKVCWGLERQFPKGGPIYRLCKMLWAEVIFDDPVDGVRIRGDIEDWERLPRNKSLFCQLSGIGIVIGNLTSQLLSNIFLDELDRYIVFSLGYKYYGRYVDDFYIVVTEAELKKLKWDIELIAEKMKGMGLEMHPRKTKIQEIHRGVEFLGVVVYPGRVQPGDRLKRNFRKTAKKYVLGVVGREKMVSYMGHLKYCNHLKLIRDTFSELGTELPWMSREDDVLDLMRKIDKGVARHRNQV